MADQLGTPKDSLVKNLSYIVTIGFFIVIIAILFFPVKVDMKDVALILMGALTTAWQTIMGYVFGSSKSSKEKDSIIANLKSTNKETKE